MKEKLTDLASKKVNQIIQASSSRIDADSVLRIQEFFSLFSENNQLLQHLYRAYKQKLTSVDLRHRLEIVAYRHSGDTHSITFSNQQIELPEEIFEQLLIYVIEITRDVLPLGTVVELNPNYFIPNEQPEHPTKVVITERFVAPTGYNSYFPYGGIIYPVGEMKKGAKVHFTEPLIQKIVHQGYRDEMEDAFIYLMKEEFIVEKNLTSIEFSKDDMKRIKADVKLKEGGV